jgi:basic membrane lipoprotein Med (substrate-binding protein (PBP1-ABC) superfamily)
MPIKGIQLIVGESYAAETEARQVAVDYPKTSFLMGSSAGPVAPNFGVFKTLNHEASYLAGMLAGTMSKTGTFGSVGAIPIPEVNNLINAFRSGVKETRPNAKFLVASVIESVVFSESLSRRCGDGGDSWRAGRLRSRNTW